MIDVGIKCQRDKCPGIKTMIKSRYFTRGAYLGGPLLADCVNIIYFGKMQQNVTLFFLVYLLFSII